MKHRTQNQILNKSLTWNNYLFWCHSKLNDPGSEWMWNICVKDCNINYFLHIVCRNGPTYFPVFICYVALGYFQLAFLLHTSCSAWYPSGHHPTSLSVFLNQASMRKAEGWRKGRIGLGNMGSCVCVCVCVQREYGRCTSGGCLPQLCHVDRHVNHEWAGGGEPEREGNIRDEKSDTKKKYERNARHEVRWCWGSFLFFFPCIII